MGDGVQFLKTAQQLHYPQCDRALHSLKFHLLDHLVGDLQLHQSLKQFSEWSLQNYLETILLEYFKGFTYKNEGYRHSYIRVLAVVEWLTFYFVKL